MALNGCVKNFVCMFVSRQPPPPLFSPLYHMQVAESSSYKTPFEDLVDHSIQKS